jgi:FG-GAP repeat
LLALPCWAESPNGLAQLPSNIRGDVTQVLSRVQLLASDGATSDEFGSSLAISSSGNTIVVGAPDKNSFEGAANVFVKPAKKWVQAAEVTVPAGLGSIAEFGGAVAISGDGSTIVVTATEDGIGAGAAYVFSATDGNWVNGWTQLAELTASDAADGDYFGSSVTMASDGETIAVGAVGATVGENQDQGAVYVFSESGGWISATQTAKLTASNGVANQNLGNAVSISGNTIAAGAWDYALGSGGPGAVYVFKKQASGWANAEQTAELTASDGAPKDILGSSVSISGNTIVAGAPNHQVGSNKYQGALYVFVEPATGWANGFQNAELTASNGMLDASLGTSVALAGSYIVGGAICQEVGSNSCQGELYGYAKPASGWANGTETYDLTAKGGAAGDELGWSSSLTATGPVAISSALAYESYTGTVYVFEQ